jgi:HD-GYP domain-containing protein (c-di-GMP phosphodiesterase class II)
LSHGVETEIRVKSLKPGEGIIGRVFTSGEIYISQELKTDPLLFEGNRESIPQGLGCIAIPIQSTAGPVGVLMILVDSTRHVTADEINLLTIMSEITGNAFHRAELFDHSQVQIQRLTAMRDIDSAIASSTDLRVTLNILIDHAVKHLQVDAVDILMYRPELQSLNLMFSEGFKTASPSRPLMRIGEGLAGQVIMKGRGHHVIDLKNSPEAKRDPLILREGFVTYIGVPLIVKGQIKGVFEVFNRTPISPGAEWMQFLQTLSGQAAIAIDNSHLFDNLQKSNQELTQAYDITLEGWARALELRDRETEGHTRRVTDLTLRLAKSMGIRDDELANIYRGVLLHDIGKMGVPDNILKKTGPLTDIEWDEMRRHPQYAFDLLSPIAYLRPALDIPYCHHEHWDGTGYPRGLKGEQIPLSARIFSVVDIWDALRSNRPYRNAWPRQKVIDYIKDQSGLILDPNIVELFLNLIVQEEI